MDGTGPVTPAVPPPASARRRLVVRVALGLPLAGVALGLIAWDIAGNHRLGLAVLLAASAALGLDEFYGLLRARGMRPAGGLAIPLAVLLILMEGAHHGRVFAAVGLEYVDAVLGALASRLGPLELGLAALLILLAQMVVPRAWEARAGLALLATSPCRSRALKRWVLGLRRRRAPDAVFGTVFGFLYLWLPLHLVFDVASQYAPPNRDSGAAMLLLLLATAKVSDSAAFLGGTFFGRHHMAPTISPKKTWEGAAAGLVAGAAAGLLVIPCAIAWRMPPGGGHPAWGTRSEWAGAAAFSLLLVVAGQLGDLVESAFKRWAGIKDSGRLLPQFGGVLDMIDSFLVSVPVAYLWVQCGGATWVFGG